jgi:hypothetical protein
MTNQRYGQTKQKRKKQTNKQTRKKRKEISRKKETKKDTEIKHVYVIKLSFLCPCGKMDIKKSSRKNVLKFFPSNAILARAIQQIAFLEVVHFDLDKMDAKSF